jgi:hypothetical protein
MNAGLLESAAVPLTRVVAEPLEHPFMGPVGAGDKTVERHDHLKNHFSIAHGGRDLLDRVNSSLIGGSALVTVDDGERATTPSASGDYR